MQLEIGEWLLHLTDHSLLSRQTKVKVETGGRKWSRSLEEIRNTAYSLALQGVLWLLSYYTTNNHLPRNSTTISGLGPLQSLIKKVTPILAYGPVWRLHFFCWGPSSKMTLACVKLGNKTKPTNQTKKPSNTQSYYVAQADLEFRSPVAGS